jgi:adenylate cyclase
MNRIQLNFVTIGKIVLSGAVAILVIIGLAVWNFYWRAPKIDPATVDKTVAQLPEIPSIAVLPFVNMSEDPKQDFFSDGISDDIINALVRWPPIRVIPRAASFIYKGKPVDVKQVSREMGVQYVLEGSIRREGKRVRINAQLIDTTTGNHVFAERFERDIQDIFAIQDEITMKILSAMRVSLHGTPSGKGTNNVEAYLKILEADVYSLNMNRASLSQARQLAEEAIALDPLYARAYSRLGAVIGNEFMIGVYEKNPTEALERAIALVEKAAQLDPFFPSACINIGFIAILMNRDYERAIAEAERAVDMAPNEASAQMMLGVYLYWGGRLEEAIPILKKVVSLTPIPISRAQSHYTHVLRLARRYEEALAVGRQLLQRDPKQMLTRLSVAATLVEMGRLEEGRAEIAELLRIDPKYNMNVVQRSFPWKDQTEVDRLIDSLRKAGLPDKPPVAPLSNPS